MKKIFTVLLLTASLMSAQTWHRVCKNTFPPLGKVFFVDENTGYIAGSNATILKTTDGGNTWFEPASSMPVDNQLYSVFFLNENVGYAGGSKDVILKTTDGGVTWGKLKYSGVNGTVRGIYFSDENTGWILSSTSSAAQVAKTTNGGATWTTVLNHNGGDLEDMSFSSAGVGVCSGGGTGRLDIYYTKDGDTWEKGSIEGGLPPVYTRTDARGIYMTDADTAHIVGWGSRAAGLQPSIHLKSTDGGKTWRYVTQPEEKRTYVNLFTVAFKDANTGFAAGGSSYEGSVVVKTTDAGETWERIEVPLGFSVKGIVVKGNKVVLSGSGGNIALSTDFGNTWKLVSPIPNSTLYTLDIVSDKVIYASGFYGLVLKTTDGGKNWHAAYASYGKGCPTIKQLFFLNENVGFAARSNMAITKTTDGGATWTLLFRDTTWTSAVNYGVCFVDENTGYVVGKRGSGVSAIYKTTDGGNTWEEKVGTFPNQLYAVWFSDANHGVVVGRDLLAYYTTDGGANWNEAVINSLPSQYGGMDIKKMKFLNADFGLASGKALLKTTDGGKTWEYVDIPILEKSIESIAIANENKWYVIGSKFIFVTEDGGANWTDITNADDIETRLLYDIGVDNNGNVWFSGGGSEIYTSAPSKVESVTTDIPREYSLSQNYPNPFGEKVGAKTTTITFGIKIGSNIQIKFYDALGRLIKTLVNQYFESGYYKIDLSSLNLSNGIYFYTLETKGRILITKKLVVLN